ncbi:uncharacterized protein [Euphorbia lathyris]|uniref:uncharacterized protein n=1 Tax=Euphorbia lathyris TaxID=212925 RepID=UPI0033134B64
MGFAHHCWISLFVLWILVLAFPISCLDVYSHERSLVVGESSKLRISPSLQVIESPGSKPGTSVLCERVHIHGLSRFKNLKKFSHSLKLTLKHSSLGLRRPNVEVCFHRNASLAIGMCSQSKWEKVDKNSWVRAMSPFDHKILDIRAAGSLSETIELSIEEGFFVYRVIFLIVGIIMLSVASPLSKSLAFYYTSSMAIGIILVILVVLFQGMKLLPTGRSNSIAIFMYSSVVGIGSFFLRYVPRLLHSVLEEIGISEDMYYPLGIFLVAFFILVGAWMGFWAVKQLVLTPDGLVDSSTSYFVTWSIRILAVFLILQSSLDPLLAVEALIFGIMLSSISRKIFRFKVWRRLLKKFVRTIKNIQMGSDVPNASLFGNSPDEYVLKAPDNRRYSRRSTLASSSLKDSDDFPSAFHATPERRKISKEAWEKFTRDSTEKAVGELVTSPDFSRWVGANAERITVTPNATRSSSKQRRKWWLLWLK